MPKYAKCTVPVLFRKQSQPSVKPEHPEQQTCTMQTPAHVQVRVGQLTNYRPAHKHKTG